MMKDKRASHTTRGKDSSYKQNKDTGRNEKRPKSMQAKTGDVRIEFYAGKKEKSRPAQGRKKARH